jgi:hypothetical protein
LPIDHLNTLDLLPGFPSKCAGIHRQRTANGAWNASKKLGWTQLPANAIARQNGACHTRSGPNSALTELFDIAKGILHSDDNASHTTITHEQIAAQTDPVHRHSRIELRNKCQQILAVGRSKPGVCNTTYSPRRMSCHRLCQSQPVYIAITTVFALSSHHSFTALNVCKLTGNS